MARSPAQGTDNLADFELRSVTEKNIVERLKQRYEKCRFYTSIGEVLLSINPCTGFLQLYGPEKIREYHRFGAVGTLAPHVYLTAAEAQRAMRRTSENQCIVLSGSPGSGKSEAKKHMLEFTVATATKPEIKLKHKLLQVHTILEAFANARTTVNSNSSRCVEYFQLLFSEDFKLQGGCVSHYLLEKTRVAHQRKGDQNFHVFYYLLAGLSADEQLEYGLDSHSSHRYLCSGVPFARDRLLRERIAEDWVELLGAFNTIGFSTLEVHAICKILAALLHLGDVEINHGDGTGSAIITNGHVLEKVASLLGVATDVLGLALVYGSTVSRGQRVSVPKSVAQAIDGRDFLAMTLYSRLVSWVVCRINQMVVLPEATKRSSRDPEIAFLDAFGFESFELNTFTQFCVNCFNEQLVYFSNQCLFAWEQDELEAEGVRVPKFILPDNSKIAEMIFMPPYGLFSLLEEEGKSIQATDASLVERFTSELKKNPIYSAVKRPYPAFSIDHYSGKVTYCASLFLSRNRDLIGASLATCMKGSRDGLVESLFADEPSDTGTFSDRNPVHSPVPRTAQQAGKKDKKQADSEKFKSQIFQPLGKQSAGGRRLSQSSRLNPSISTICKNSLCELLDRMLSCKLHFVRCIRPNASLHPNSFDDHYVISQLRHLAVLDTARMRIAGFPIRLPFSTFVRRYQILVFSATSNFKENASTCEKILARILPDQGWSVGKTKVMMTYWGAQKLDSILDRVIRLAIVIQKNPESEDQVDISDISLSDVFNGSADTTPGRPSLSSRASNLSAMSCDSTFSTDSVFADEQLGPRPWCKVLCYDRETKRGEFKKYARTLVIDGSGIAVDETRIGFGTLPMDTSDPKVVKVRKRIGKGISLEQDEYNNVWATRRSKNPVFFKGSFPSVEVIVKKGALPHKKTCKVFDYEAFTNHVNCESRPENFQSLTEVSLLMACSVCFSFVKDGIEDVETPCWVEVQILDAIKDVRAACEQARDAKKARKRSTGDRMTSPEPRADSETGVRKSREFSAVAKYAKEIRPGKEIDSFRFKRRDWARKEVSLNPFMFGQAQELEVAAARPSPSGPSKDGSAWGPERQGHDGKDGSESAVAAASLSDAFAGAGGDAASREEAETISPAMDEEDAGAPSGEDVQSPRRKQWAKKKFAEKKELEEERTRSRRSTVRRS